MALGLDPSGLTASSLWLLGWAASAGGGGVMAECEITLSIANRSVITDLREFLT